MAMEFDTDIPLDKFLQNAKHPVVYHILHGKHPGKNWWLKTICPDPTAERLDTDGYGHLWGQFNHMYPNLVTLTDLAFDWIGNKIPYTYSVWLNVEIDIVIKSLDSIEFIKRHEGDCLVAELIKHDKELKKNPAFMNAANCLIDQAIEEGAKLKRKNLRVIRGME